VRYAGDARLIVGAADGKVRHFLRSLAQTDESDAPLLTQPSVEHEAHEGRVLSLDVSSDGKWYATGGEDNLVRLWQAEDGKLLAELDDHVATVRVVRFSNDGRWLASGSDDRTARLWDLQALTLDPQKHLETLESRFEVELESSKLKAREPSEAPQP
jgi:WD40 repeat protein